MRYLYNIFLSAMILMSNNCYAQKQRIEKLRLAGEMIYTKSYSENAAFIILNDTDFIKKNPKPVDSIIILYQRIQFATDQVVFALISVLDSKSRPKAYKTLDKQLFKKSLEEVTAKSSHKYQGIVNGLKQINSDFSTFVSYLNFLRQPAANASPHVFPRLPLFALSIEGGSLPDIFGSLYSIFNDARERKSGQAKELAGLVQLLRLNQVNELLKKPEKKDDAK